MTDPAPGAMGVALPDPSGYVTRSSERIHQGRVIGLRVDEVAMPDGSTARREVVDHPGAVAVVAIDEDDRVVMLTQYRHPVGRFLWELPAGILDHPGEIAVEAARRELAEEAGLGADQWHTLVDLITAPGFADEAIRVFLATGLHEVQTDFVRAEEEAELTTYRIPLLQCVSGALDGTIENSLAVAGLLAVAAARAEDIPLRAPDAPWAAQKRS